MKAMAMETDVTLHGRQQRIIVVYITNRPDAAKITKIGK